jgi:hypothetical protein
MASRLTPRRSPARVDVASGALLYRVIGRFVAGVFAH